MAITTDHTSRGFRIWTFPAQDYSGEPVYTVQVQQSSLATEPKVWVGPAPQSVSPRAEHIVGGRMHLSVEAATDLRDALTEWLKGVGHA